MKKILVPTDFSDISLGAAIYAIEFAKCTSAQILLFHAYHPPLPTNGADFGILPDYNLEEENKLKIEAFKKSLVDRLNPGIEINTEVKIGFAVDEIVDCAANNGVDLIIMGISGGGRISEFVLGSNTTGVIEQVNIPVIIVPPNAKFIKPRAVVFANDYKNEISAKNLAELKNFLHHFHSKLYVLNLEKPEEGVTFQKAVNGINLENALSQLEHTLHFLPHVSDYSNEFNDFVESHDAQLLIMLPHRKGLLKKIFHPSVTKHVSFHSHVPILALSEK